MSGRSFAVQIGSHYLTSDGTETGKPCKVVVKGIEAARSNYTGKIEYAASGMPYLFTVEVGEQGKQFEIVIAYCPKDLLDDLVAAINEALDAGVTIRVIATGDSGAFDVQALPTLPEWLSVGAFSGGIVKDVVFRFVSAGAGV